MFVGQLGVESFVASFAAGEIRPAGAINDRVSHDSGCVVCG